MGGYENRESPRLALPDRGNEIRLNWRARRKQHEGEARWQTELAVCDLLPIGRSPGMEEVEEQARQFARLHEALSRLSERYQTILALRYFESLSCEEVAEVDRTKVGTVESLIHRLTVKEGNTSETLQLSSGTCIDLLRKSESRGAYRSDRTSSHGNPRATSWKS